MFGASIHSRFAEPEAAMATTEVPTSEASHEADAAKLDMKLEVVVLPVSNVDRAAAFYERLGWRKDADLKNADSRILQFTSPGSSCSIIFGTNLTPAGPGSSQFLHLIVSDIEAARQDLVSHGVDASEVFHDKSGGFNRFDPRVRASGPDPERRSYASFVVFSDPDRNGWVLQEITQRWPGRIDTNETCYSSVSDLANAMRRAEAAHGEHEKRIGRRDENWADWYAQYMAADQTGQTLPT